MPQEVAVHEGQHVAGTQVTVDTPKTVRVQLLMCEVAVRDKQDNEMLAALPMHATTAGKAFKERCRAQRQGEA